MKFMKYNDFKVNESASMYIRYCENNEKSKLILEIQT